MSLRSSISVCVLRILQTWAGETCSKPAHCSPGSEHTCCAPQISLAFGGGGHPVLFSSFPGAVNCLTVRPRAGERTTYPLVSCLFKLHFRPGLWPAQYCCRARAEAGVSSPGPGSVQQLRAVHLLPSCMCTVGSHTQF